MLHILEIIKNTFNFQNMKVNYREINVDGQPVTNRPFKTNYAENDYVTSYLSLMDNDYKTDKGIIIDKSDYPKGYALYLFDIQSFIAGNIMTSSPKRLNVRFAQALKETINIIVYAKFPEAVKIDHTRNVYL